jgi:hypothetical protein
MSIFLIVLAFLAGLYITLRLVLRVIFPPETK